MNCDHCGDNMEDAINPIQLVSGDVKTNPFGIDGHHYERYCSKECLKESL